MSSQSSQSGQSQPPSSEPPAYRSGPSVPSINISYQADPDHITELSLNVSSDEGSVSMNSNTTLGHISLPEEKPKVAGARVLDHVSSYSLVNSSISTLNGNRFTKKIISKATPVTKRLVSYTALYPPDMVLASDDNGEQQQQQPTSSTTEEAADPLDHSLLHRLHISLYDSFSKADEYLDRTLAKIDQQITFITITIITAGRSVTKYLSLPYLALKNASNHFTQAYSDEHKRWSGNNIVIAFGAFAVTIVLAGFDVLVAIGDWVFDSRNRNSSSNGNKKRFHMFFR